MANEANSDNPLGKRFRNAREALGLSVSEVAERLHIIPKYVRCIESNEYSQLPGVVFLKGYIRSYARLLGLPEDQVVSQLEEALTASGSYVESADRFAALPPPPREGLGTALLFLAVLMLAAGAGWYWLQRAPLEPALSAGSGAAGSGAAGSGAAGSGVAGSGVAGSGASTWAAAGNEAVAGRILDRAEAPEAILAAEEAEAVGQSRTPLPISLGDDGQAADGENEIGEAADATGESDDGVGDAGGEFRLPIDADDMASPEVGNHAADTIAEPVAGSALRQPEGEGVGSDIEARITLTAVFSGDCWFDARDRDNERVVQLFRAGQQVSFTGLQPVRVIIGAADRISLSVDGRPLDLRRYPVRNNRVEFILEP